MAETTRKRRPLSGILGPSVPAREAFRPAAPPTPPGPETDSQLLLSIRNWLRALGVIWLILVVIGGLAAWNSIQNAAL